MRFKVGDKVKVRNTFYRVPQLRETTVIRCGRKYVYVEGYKEGFDGETGQMKDSSAYRLVTDEDLARAAAIKHATDRLRDWGIDTWNLSNDKCLALYKAMKAAGLVE